MKQINMLNDAMFKALFRSIDARRQDIEDAKETGLRIGREEGMEKK